MRLEAGSTEAGFLAAFCPLSNLPTLVVIQYVANNRQSLLLLLTTHSNGQLREQLSSGVDKDEFINRVRKVLGAEAIPGPGATQTPSATPQAATSPAPAQPSSEDRPATPDSASTTEERIPVSPILPPSSKAKGKQKVTPPESKPNVSSTKAAQQSARDALRKKKQEEKEELARIQARIEADKAERRAQAEARKAERERLAESSTTVQNLASTSNKGSQAKDVHLNVRLFDGRTIRSTFSRTAKLQDDVRPWIDKEFEEKAEPNEKLPPYYFKQILAPLPSRELSAGEESETLGDINLAPSATLVLIPVKGYTEAYSGSGGGGVVNGVVGGVTGLIGGAFGLAYSTVGYVGSTLGSFVGYGGPSNQEPEQPSTGRSLSETRPEPESSNTSNIRVRTLADQRAREPRSQQLYNGNQVSHYGISLRRLKC